MNDQLVEIYFKYGEKNNILNAEQLEKLQAICSRKLSPKQLNKYWYDKFATNEHYYESEEVKQHEDYKILVEYYDIGSQRNIVPLMQLLNSDLNVKYEIENKIKEIPEYSMEENILHRLLKLDEKLSKFDYNAQFNTKVGVHISDLALMNIKHVTWLEDACTETLQTELNKGWRILAICPQPDSRRPDYVLGRNDPIVEEESGSCRRRY